MQITLRKGSFKARIAERKVDSRMQFGDDLQATVKRAKKGAPQKVQQVTTESFK